MQLLGSISEEDITAECLNFLSFKTQKLRHEIFSKPIPHIGWNQVNFLSSNPIFSGIKDGSDFYFSHSFAVLKSKNMIASTEYEIDFVSALNSENLYGVQFHPERSQDAGKKLLHNFLNLS
jgi:glutamine amidotransferase